MTSVGYANIALCLVRRLETFIDAFLSSGCQRRVDALEAIVGIRAEKIGTRFGDDADQ